MGSNTLQQAMTKLIYQMFKITTAITTKLELRVLDKTLVNNYIQ